ncbi:MAG: putative response regulator [Geobacteraceae bacterium]|nr:putative response regulator [Geobacteraceae bacterium]
MLHLITNNIKNLGADLAKGATRILVVDDEENARMALTRLLAKEGFLVESVANGYEALNYLRHQPVQIIVTDINMPEMDGISFLKELNRSFPKMNVIMVTAYGGVESYLEAMNLGAFEYINKPVKIDELKLVLKKVLRETIH